MKSKVLVFLLGLLCGVAGAVLLPPRIVSYLPAGIGGLAGTTEGVVEAERRQGERLLLTLVTEEGASLVTFSQRADEVDLLVGVGDRVTLAGSGYRPFLEEPEISRVLKAEAAEKAQRRGKRQAQPEPSAGSRQEAGAADAKEPPHGASEPPAGPGD